MNILNKPLFYVDDDPDDLEIFIDVAQTLGIEAYVFSKGDKLLKAILNPPPQPAIVFVDLNMPEITGFEVISHIKDLEDYNHIPIVILSTANDALSIKKSRSLGASYYITKPTSMAALKNALKHVVSMDWEAHDPSTNFVHPFS